MTMKERISSVPANIGIPAPTDNDLDEQTLASLAGKTADELTDDDIRRLSRKRLINMLISCKDERVVLPVINALLDKIAPEAPKPADEITKIEVVIIDPKADS